MKKIILLIAALGLIYANALSQGCLPQGIAFTTQAEIDNFQTNYPGCKVIEGDVYVVGSNITNLNGLSVLTSIEGELFIWDNPSLTGLAGLENLTSIGGSLSIGDWEEGNPALTSLTGLENLTFIGADLGIGFNDGLTNLSGLDNLTTIEGDVWIGGNNSLTNLIGLESLTNLEGNLSIIENSSLNSLTGLESLTSTVGYISIYGNNSLTSLTGLEGLTSIGWMLVIDFNNSLTSLIGLDNLTEVGGFLAIGIDGGNQSLTSLTGLESLTSISGELYIGNNNSLTDLTGLANIAAGSITDLTIQNNPLLATCEVKSICDYLAAPNVFFIIENNAPGCNSPEEVIAACEAIGIEEILSESEFMLAPNPFKDQLIIEFTMKIPGLVSIEIFNAMGAKVAELHNGQLPAGQQQFAWNAGHLPKGLYFCRVQAGEETRTQKIIKVQ